MHTCDGKLTRRALSCRSLWISASNDTVFWRECVNCSQILSIFLWPLNDLCFVLFVSVKYMREATPYVKKGSPVSEIGWETPPPESPRLGSPHFELSSPPSLSLQGDRRCIPLKMCYITRSMTVPDPENRYCFFYIQNLDHRKFVNCTLSPIHVWLKNEIGRKADNI